MHSSPVRYSISIKTYSIHILSTLHAPLDSRGLFNNNYFVCSDTGLIIFSNLEIKEKLII